MRIGERQSDLIDWEACITISNGDMYENQIHLLLDKPLDMGRLFYAKLRNAIPRNVSVEVYWNHFDDELTGVVTGRSFEFETTFLNPVMARTDKIVYIEAIIDRFKERVSFLQPLS